MSGIIRWWAGLAVVVVVLAGCQGGGTLGPVGGGEGVRQRSLAVLEESAGSGDAVLRCHALEGLAACWPGEAWPAVRRGLGDEVAAVRFAAALAAGDARVSSARPMLEKLLRDDSAAVRLAAGYGLEKLGDGRFGGWYDQALAGRDARLQGQACLLLGKLGATEVHPEARQQLWRVLRQVGQGASVKLQAAEALARLGDDSVLAKLLAYASSGYADDRILAIAGLGELSGEADARAMLFVLSEDVQAEVALAAVRALGRRATAEQLEWARGQLGSGGIEGDAGSRSRVRALAALAVGATGGPGDAQRLGRLLGDESGYVRVAAARAVGECLGGHRGESKGMK